MKGGIIPEIERIDTQKRPMFFSAGYLTFSKAYHFESPSAGAVSPNQKKGKHFESHLCSWACCCQGSLLSLEIHSRWAQKPTLNSRSMSGVKNTTPSSPQKFSAISRGQTFHSLFKDQSGAHLVGCLAVKVTDSRSCESQLLYVSPTDGTYKIPTYTLAN